MVLVGGGISVGPCRRAMDPWSLSSKGDWAGKIQLFQKQLGEASWPIDRHWPFWQVSPASLHGAPSASSL